MRYQAFSWLILLGITDAQAEEHWPLRVAYECQTEMDIDVCDYVGGYLAATPGLRSVERSHADVVIYTNVSGAGIEETILFTVESRGELSPTQFEVRRVLPSRTDAEASQSEIAEMTLQVLSPYVLQLNPTALSIALEEVGEEDEDDEDDSPYGLSLYTGSWFYLTSGYKNYEVWGRLSLSSVEEDRRWYVAMASESGWNQQPPLVIDDVAYSLDSSTSAVSGEILYARDLNPTWSVGGTVSAGMEDQEQRFERTGRFHMGVERNWFPSDDLRNNRFAVAYLLGVQGDRYNQTNVLGETAAIFPKQMLLASGSVRKGGSEYSFGIDLIADLLHPARQYMVSGWMDGSFFLGDHVDLNFWLSATQQAIPGPAEVDQSDFEEITQGAYAEPIEVNGTIYLHFHWDRSNGALYNRFRSAGRQSALENL